MTVQTITKDNHSAVKSMPKTSVHERVLTPLVNIMENEYGFTLSTEMTGVPKENIKVHVENMSLILEGEIALKLPENVQFNYQEQLATRYKRVFTLSRDLDASKIDASQKNGVLTVHIPKAEHAQPRKIEVQIG